MNKLALTFGVLLSLSCASNSQNNNTKESNLSNQDIVINQDENTQESTQGYKFLIPILDSIGMEYISEDIVMDDGYTQGYKCNITSESIESLHQLLYINNVTFGEGTNLKSEIPEDEIKIRYEDSNPYEIRIAPKYNNSDLINLKYEFEFAGGITTVEFSKESSKIIMTIIYSAD